MVNKEAFKDGLPQAVCFVHPLIWWSKKAYANFTRWQV